MERLLKELRNTNAAMRELRGTKMTITQLLLLDERLLELEASVGLMDGLPVVGENDG